MKDKKIILIGGGYLIVQEILDKIAQLRIPMKKVQILNTCDRVGEIHDFKSQPVPVNAIELMYEEGYDLAIILSPVEGLQDFTKTMLTSNIPIVDMSNTFKASTDIPVLLPESDLFTCDKLPEAGVIPTRAAHAFSTILNELGNIAHWNQAIVSSIQGVACQGSRLGMDELLDQTRAILGFDHVESKVFPKQIAFNAFHDSSKSEENTVMLSYGQFISGRQNFTISSDLVWCGFFVGIVGTIWLFSETPVSLEIVENTLKRSSAVKVNEPVSSVLETAGTDCLVVGGLALAEKNSQCLKVRFTMDNLHRGLATSITELMKKVWRDD